MSYSEQVRQELLAQLQNGEITEEEFWEYYNQEVGDYDETQASCWNNRTNYE